MVLSSVLFSSCKRWWPLKLVLASAKIEHGKGRHANLPVNYLTYDLGSRRFYNLITWQHCKHPPLPPDTSLELCILIVTLKLKSTKHHPWCSIVNMTCCVCNLWANLHIKAQLSSSRNHSESIGITTRAIFRSLAWLDIHKCHACIWVWFHVVSCKQNFCLWSLFSK